MVMLPPVFDRLMARDVLAHPERWSYEPQSAVYTNRRGTRVAAQVVEAIRSEN
jgi:hypothetical protein